MKYLGEFRTGWPNLLGATVGVALGSALNHYLMSLFGPPLLAEFGWEKSEFALVGTLGLAGMVTAPFMGRLTDRLGARSTATIGFTILPLCFLAYSLMTGPIWQFYLIYMVKSIFGILTTTLVFTRVIIRRFDRARGIALALLMTGPPLAGAVLTPLVAEIIDAEGWRAGYRAMAAMAAAGGFVAILLVGKRSPAPAAGTARPKLTWGQFAGLLRRPAFGLLVGGMLLVNIPQIIVMSQLKLILIDKGTSDDFATWAVSLYAIGVMGGRFVSGLALDRLPAHIVAGAFLGLPALGMIALLSPLQAGMVLAGGVLLVGLAQGAEGDLGAYLTSRNFAMENYSLAYSMVIIAIGAGAVIGSALLGWTLAATDSFGPFLTISAIVTIIGAACFYLTGRFPRPKEQGETA